MQQSHRLLLVALCYLASIHLFRLVIHHRAYIHHEVDWIGDQRGGNRKPTLERFVLCVGLDTLATSARAPEVSLPAMIGSLFSPLTPQQCRLINIGERVGDDRDECHLETLKSQHHHLVAEMANRISQGFRCCEDEVDAYRCISYHRAASLTNPESHAVEGPADHNHPLALPRFMIFEDQVGSRPGHEVIPEPERTAKPSYQRVNVHLTCFCPFSPLGRWHNRTILSIVLLSSLVHLVTVCLIIWLQPRFTTTTRDEDEEMCLLKQSIITTRFYRPGISLIALWPLLLAPHVVLLIIHTR